MKRRSFLKGALVTVPALLSGPSLLRPGRASAQNIGPSTTTEPYMIPSVDGVSITSILTVGDSIGGYRMVGIPDGLDAFNSDRHHFTLLMNHELNSASGVPRAHGSKGAFVSRWTHILGAGWFLFDVQVHKASTDPELVEGGQLLAMFVDPSIGAPPDDADDDDDDDDDDERRGGLRLASAERALAP